MAKSFQSVAWILFLCWFALAKMNDLARSTSEYVIHSKEKRTSSKVAKEGAKETAVDILEKRIPTSILTEWPVTLPARVYQCIFSYRDVNTISKSNLLISTWQFWSLYYFLFTFASFIEPQIYFIFCYILNIQIITMW